MQEDKELEERGQVNKLKGEVPRQLTYKQSELLLNHNVSTETQALKGKEHESSSLIGHQESYQELTKYEQYLEYRLKRIYLVKKILLQIIQIYEGLSKPSELQVQDIHLLIFLLDAVEYVNNFHTIKTFGLDQEDYKPGYEIPLHEDLLVLDRISQTHRGRLNQLKKHYFLKIDLINQKFLGSIQKRTPLLLQQFKEHPDFQALNCLLEEMSLMLFPKVEGIRTIYFQFLSVLKKEIYPSLCHTMPLQELRLFYLWEYLIDFHTAEEDLLYLKPDHLSKLRQSLFNAPRQEMVEYLFSTAESNNTKKQVKKE